MVHNSRGFYFSTWVLIIKNLCFLSCIIIHTVSSKDDIFARVQNTAAAAEESIYYSIDGSNNNEKFPSWGQRRTPRIRHLPNASLYFDQIAPNTGGGIPVDEYNSNLPSARRIMENIFSRALAQSDKGTNHLMLEFGHFIVQDIIGRTLMNETEPFPMPCDGEVIDRVFCPVTGKSIPFDRSQHVVFLASHIPRRASLNGETAFLDMSNMYGNTPEAQKQIREGIAGRLRLNDEGFPPILDKYNSSPGVFALYCVFMRYHNKLANEIMAKNRSSTPTDGLTVEERDEKIFQMARKKMIAIYQYIAEEKYIPMLLGSQLKTYDGYNKSVDPSIDEFFAAASFRYAHSSFSGLVRLMDKDFNPTGSDPLLLRDVFRQPEPNNVPRVVRNHGGIEPFLRGLTVTNAKAVDASLVHDLNYFSEATSLLDIQRGRDMGLPSYNDAREAFGLTRANDFEDLVQYDDQKILDQLKELYNNDIDKLDAYVGALLEKKDSGAEMGPLFTRSIKNQFERVRDGDRFWYRNQYPREEWEEFPTLTELINATCPDMANFPKESFTAFDGVVDAGADTATCETKSSQLSLLGGDFLLGWRIDVPTKEELREQPNLNSTIEVNMTFTKPTTGPGFIGVGWGSLEMKGAEIWFCTVDAGLLAIEPVADSCGALTSDKTNANHKLFSCCLAEGGMHVQPVCSSPDALVWYELKVVTWCLTPTSSMVTVEAPVCDENADFSINGKVDCFRTKSKSNGEMDFIAAYNPERMQAHGYQRRTYTTIDLSAGRQTGSEGPTADDGLIATHAIFMLCGWMVFAPAAVFIARYMKTRRWRLAWHVSLMGIVGSMMLPLLVGIEASVGATDKTQEHSVVGLSLCGVYFFMVFAGRVRYLKLQGKKVGRKTYLLSFILHKYGGVVIVLLAWWNCYTGLVRIGPEDSYFQVFLLSSFPLGYNLEIFGFIRQHIFFPYLGVVCFIFIVAEGRRYRLSSSSHATKLQGILTGRNTIWEDGADKFLDKMTMDSFMDATKLGTILCIVDGYVLDITSFVENHPGGQHLLRYAAGSDITEEFVGKRDVDGLRHVHSHSAVQLMKTFVKAVLVDEENNKLSFMKGQSSKLGIAKSTNGKGFGRMSLMETIAKVPKTRRGASVFRRGRVVGLKYLTPNIEITHTCKPVILLQVALPKTRSDLHVQKLISLPSCAFTFRGIDSNNTAVDRQYTPVSIHNSFADRSTTENDEEIFDFVISLVPGGKMSKILLDMRIGKVLLAQGPTVNQETVTKFRTGGWRSVVMIAAGTGVSPMLQVIDYYISKLSTEVQGMTSVLQTEVPDMYLMWIVKGPNYNYAETLALDARVDRSHGKFKYTVIYSTSKGKKQVETPRQKLQHQWTFLEVMDKTNPKKLAYRKHKKVKREVLDAAWKLKKSESPSLMTKKFQSSRRTNDESNEEPSDEFSILNEITEATWSGENVQTCYRSYNKMLLEELLLSIPNTVAPARTSSNSAFLPSSMPSIEEDSQEDEDEGSDFFHHFYDKKNTSSSTGDSAKDNDSYSSYDSSLKDPYNNEGSISSGSRSDSYSSGFRSDSYTSDSYFSGTRSGSDGFLSRITEITERTDDTLSERNERKAEAAKVPDSIALAEKEETGTVSTERSGSSPDSNPRLDHESNLMTSWLPPQPQDRAPWMPPLGIDAAKNASYASDYVSFDHKQLMGGFSTSPNGTIFRNPTPPPPPKPSHRIPPRLGSPPPEPKSPVPKSISAPSIQSSSQPSQPKDFKPTLGNRVASSPVPFARNIPVSQNKPAIRTNPIRVPSLEPGEAKKINLEEPERPSLENRTPSKTLESQTDSRKLLSRRETRVEQLLDQHEIDEEEYRARRILVAISGAPMFEYKTRVNLGDLGFPAENMVTFHASAQQL